MNEKSNEDKSVLSPAGHFEVSVLKRIDLFDDKSVIRVLSYQGRPSCFPKKVFRNNSC